MIPNVKVTESPPFTTTDDQKVELWAIASAMRAAGLSASFITAAIRRAEEYEGTFDLLALWRDSSDDTEGQAEREQIIADIQELLDEGDEAGGHPLERPHIRFDELKSIAEKVAAFKLELRKKVDAWGGVAKLARAAGIPQPSLRRFFSSASMPRRTTLYKIARTIGLSENDIVTDWVR